MKKLSTAALLLTAAVSMTAQASFVSGQHVLSNGNKVDLQGLEWLPLAYTAGLDRIDIADGFTDAFGGVWHATSWRFATRAETSRLLWSLAVVGDGWSAQNHAGASWFRTYLGTYLNGSYSNSTSLEWSYALFGYGAANECPDANTCYYGAMGVDSSLGWFHHNNGLTISNNSNVVYNEYHDKSWAHLLVRSATTASTVAGPSSMILFGLGLLPLVLRRRSQFVR